MTDRFTRTVLGLFVLTAGGLTASAATVRRAEDTPIVGRLVRIADGNLYIVADGKTDPSAIPLGDVTEVLLADTPSTRPTGNASTRPSVAPPATRPATTAKLTTTAPAAAATRPAGTLTGQRPWRVTLGGSDTLTIAPAGWADGRLTGTVAGRLPVDLPVDSLRELWCGPADQVAAAKALGEAATLDDVAYAVRDGKVLAVHGVAGGLDGDAIRFTFGGQERKIGLARLVGIAFARPAVSPTAASAPQQAFTLSSGDTVPGTWTAVSPTTVDFMAAWGQPMSLPRREVASIVFRNGRVLSLSDLNPSTAEQTPYFGRIMPWQVDKALDGKPLLLADGPLARGIAVHSKTVLSYPLAGAFERFRTHVGFQVPAGRSGEAIIRVSGDGRVLFEKADAKGTDAPFDVSVAITGVQTLTLEVDFGPNQDVGDRVVWGNARLIRLQAQGNR